MINTDMKVSDIVKPFKMYIARILVKQPGYSGNMEVTVTAPNLFMARQLIKRQYNVTDSVINSIREMK